uniref:Reverse transcriptase zinc-binding domain-containing protein n=1 Tax=Aegilops tauschii subsp. strangulata TaxID=200361 RepID=A0A453KKL1_AEGTS
VDRLNTRNMLKRRHYNIGSTFDCLLCGTHTEETVEHLFSHCSFSKECWQALGIHWAPSGGRLDLLQSARAAWSR